MKRPIVTQLPALPGPGAWSDLQPEQAFDAFFEPLRDLIGRDWLGYRNHCLRVFLNVRALAPGLDLKPVIPALVFHDIGLWTHHTLDYIAPSETAAQNYLESVQADSWIEPVQAMIRWHHKQRVYRGPHAEYVEPVRRADMGDFTFGLQGHVPRAVLRNGRSLYPNAGFHAMLLRRSLGRLISKPWSPAPMLRW